MRVIFIKTQSINERDEVDACHACSAEIGAVTYKRINNEWQIVTKQKKIGDVGSWGDAPETQKAEILKLSPDKFAFLINDWYSTMGQTESGVLLFVFAKNNWRYTGFITTQLNDSGNCEEGDVKHCFSYEGKISVISGNKEYPDLLVTKIGTEGKDNKGNVIPAKSAFYVFNGNQYVQKP